jgi:hypothetical protein
MGYVSRDNQFSRQKKVLDAWGQVYVDLDPLQEQFGDPDAALLDLWHFSGRMHFEIALDLESRLRANPSVGDAEQPKTRV